MQKQAWSRQKPKKKVPNSHTPAKTRSINTKSTTHKYNIYDLAQKGKGVWLK